MPPSGLRRCVWYNYAKNSEHDERNELKGGPGSLVVDTELYVVTVAIGIDGAHNEGANHGAEEGAPHGLERKVVAHFFQAEEDATDGRTESDGHTGGRGSREDFALLGLVLSVLGKEIGEDVATAAGDMDEGSFLAEYEASTSGEHHADGLDEQRPFAKVTSDDESAENGLDLENFQE